MDNKILYDLLKEMREEQRKHGDELKDQSKCLVVIQKDVERNTEDLTEHKEGVIQNRRAIELLKEDIDLIQQRYDDEITKIKEPSKVKAYIYDKGMKYLAATSVILGIIATATKLTGLW